MNDKFLRLIIILAFIAATHQLKAQNQDTALVASTEQKALAVASRLQRDLGLSEAQTKKITTICSARIRSLQQNKSAKMSSNTLKAVNDDSQRQLASVLTKEQLDRYKSLRADSQRQKEEYYTKHARPAQTQEDIELDF